jgi:hypothetical protein
MKTHRTSKCSALGHREFTIQLRASSPVPSVERILLDFFEDSVARGTKFVPGQTVQLGWSTLRLCDRTDGTIGVEEREPRPDVAWTESVDRALVDIWLQKEVAASVGLLDALTFPRQDDMMMAANCAVGGEPILMMRLDAKDLPDGFSGWTLACAREHDHGERHLVPLLALAANQPGLVQLLALPHGTQVLVKYKPIDGRLRIEPHVLRDGKELHAHEGSYLAALQQ